MHLVEDALQALSHGASHLSHPDALRYAMTAYFNFRDAHLPLVRKPYLYFVDYGLSNRRHRGFVFDMVQLSLHGPPFTVAHGSGSSTDRDAVPMTFNNVGGSNACSLGLYLTLDVYLRPGHFHIDPVTHELKQDHALRIRGYSGDFNSNAETRLVVIHGADYVTPNGAGRSQGCPAMEMTRAENLMPILAQGSVVFLFSPNDAAWLAKDPWVHPNTKK